MQHAAPAEAKPPKYQRPTRLRSEVDEAMLGEGAHTAGAAAATDSSFKSREIDIS